ncbi:MAG: M14 metallopeptidase family protein [Flavobacteriaceae bacterium]
MIRLIIFSLLLSLNYFSNAQIQSPEEFLGYPLGENFSRHHQVLDYYKHLADNSTSIQLHPYGKTNEGRLLQLAILSTPENLKNLETIRINHMHNSGMIKGPKNDDKVIIWLSYNVHGNESSSTEASMKTAHALLTQYQDWLTEAIIIIDPCINPDGRDRYVNFYNQTKSNPYDSNILGREHREPWHNGRTNHYIFDLNRDWAWLTQVESQQRLVLYNRWLPHVHVDFHEQGINSPYYFAPATEPLHEVITDFQKDFQDTLGKNHASYFDKEGWLYFTKQTFDLLYPSYGDTYPTYLGAIGMTYEQAGGGIAGLGVDNNENIELTLKDRIEHHYTTGISTVETSVKHKLALNKNYQDYYDVSKLKYKNFILEGNSERLESLARFLEKHEIQSYSLEKASIVKGYDYQQTKNTITSFSGNALVIPTQQPKGKMAQVLLEPTTKLNDSVTYDITAWSLPYAYGLKANATPSEIAIRERSITKFALPTNDNSNYGYGLEYDSFEDSQFLAALLKAGLGVRFNTVPISNSGKNWDRGSLFILKGDNLKNENFVKSLEELVSKFNKELFVIKTGYSSAGPDLGADEIILIKAPKVAVLRSDSASAYAYGEVWHFFEQQLHYPLLQLDQKQLLRGLDEIDVLILPHGYYSKISDNTTDNALKAWIQKGGKLIALAGALKRFAQAEGFVLKKKEIEDRKTTTIQYGDLERQAMSDITTGSIFEANLDKTHPLSYGIEQYYTLKLDESVYEFIENENNVATLPENTKPISGFMGYYAKQQQKNTLLFGEESVGNGRVIYFVDNVLFRGFWYNGKMAFSNALFF